MTHDAIEPLAGVRTKIVATVGPASRAPDRLRALLEAGVDLFRLNFSHGSHDDHAAMLSDIRRVAHDMDRAVGVLMDLGGPKIRLGEIQGGMISCNMGDHFVLTPEPDPNDPYQLSCSYPDLPRDLTTGDLVLFADGTVAMEVIEDQGDRVRLQVTLPGPLRSRQGINVPGSALGIETLTEKDRADLDWAAEHDVDFVALSFVRSGADLARLRQEMKARNIPAWVVAKIEKPQAVEQLDAILALSDVVMIARGDLGVELDVARVPAIQKRIIREAHKARVPVITATQMLTTMEHSNRPTRAEASDVFNAVVDGTDAVMLSGETAVGAYPVEAVSTMSRILAEAERSLGDHWPEPPTPSRLEWISPITEAVVESSSVACRRLNASLLAVATHSGRTALAVSMHRNPTPTIALCETPGDARHLSILWGVVPLSFPEIEDFQHALDFAVDWAQARGLISTGDRVVLLRGFMPDQPTHNAMIVREIGQGR